MVLFVNAELERRALSLHTLYQSLPHARALDIGINEERADPIAKGGDEADNNSVLLGHGDIRARQVFSPSNALLSIQIILR